MIEESWETARVEVVPYHSKAKNVFVLAGVPTLLATACEHEIMLADMVLLYRVQSLFVRYLTR